MAKIELDDDPTLKGGPQQDTLFPDIDNSDKKPDPEPDPNEDRIAALEKEIAAGKERDVKNQEIINNMSRQPAPATAPPAAEQLPVEAPDPVVDPEGYKAHIKAEITGEVKQEIGALRAETAKTNTYNQLWTEFAKDNKDLAENHIDLVKFQATEILREVAGMGVDPQQYLMTNKTIFMGDVASRTNNMISKIKGDALDTGRTDGVLSDSPRTTTPKKTDGSQEEVSNFVKELQDAQMKTGFF